MYLTDFPSYLQLSGPVVATTAVTCRTFLDTCWLFRSDSTAFLLVVVYHRYAEMHGLSVFGGSTLVDEFIQENKTDYKELDEQLKEQNKKLYNGRKEPK